MQPTKKIGQEQIHGLLFSDQLSWQSLILDLINSEQLDPWDVDITILTNKYLEKIHEMEEADLFVSSKVLFAASLLLRIKSEILLNHYLPSLDDILFGRKEDKKYYNSMQYSNNFYDKHIKSNNLNSLTLIASKSDKMVRDYNYSSKVFYSDIEESKLKARRVAKKSFR